jgi:hypothetical protein
MSVPEQVSGSIWPARPTPRGVAGLVRRSEANVVRHGVRAWERSQIDRIDSLTLRDAVQTAFQEECSFVDYGLSLAGDSVTKQRLLADKVALLAAVNNQRIGRRFS